MENKYLQVRKENIFTKCINFIKGIFIKKVEKEIPAKIETIENRNVKSDYLNDIKIYKEENKELLDLQSKYENKEIDLGVMSDEEIHELNLLYKRQISDLKKNLEDKKTQLSIMKHRIKNYSANM